MFLCFCQDVTPYMNPCPYMVYPWTPVPLVFNLFRTMGLRHLIVINTKGQVCRNHLFAWANNVAHSDCLALTEFPWLGEPKCLKVKKLVQPGGLPYHHKRVTLLAGPMFWKNVFKLGLSKVAWSGGWAFYPSEATFLHINRTRKTNLLCFSVSACGDDNKIQFNSWIYGTLPRESHFWVEEII